MDARPSSDQRDLTNVAERLATRLGPTAVGDLDDAERNLRLDSAVAQAGWRELRAGSKHEPLASGVEAVIVARALAHHACDTAYLGPLLAHDLLRRVGYEGPDLMATVVVDSSLRHMALATGDSVVDRGLAIDAACARVGMVVCHSYTALSLGVVALGEMTSGVDLTRPVVNVMPGASVLPVVGTGAFDADALESWTALAVTLTAADLVGAMQGATELATAYAKQRRQYGAAIGSYQAVQHLLAEAATLIEGAASAVNYAGWAVDALPGVDARSAAAVAKAYASRAALVVCETSIQVHGGIGNTWECMAHVFLRRALLSTELFGGAGPHMALLAQQRWGANHGLS